MDLLTVVDRVIEDCEHEWEFTQFNDALYAGEGWQWILSRPRLRAAIKMPTPPAGDVWLTDQQAQLFVHKVVVGKEWNMLDYIVNGHAISKGNTAFGRAYFFKDLFRKLGRGVLSNRFISANPASGKTFASTHEGGIQLKTLPHGGGYTAFQLVGDTSSGWGGLQTAGQKFLAFMDDESDLRPSKRLSKITKGEVDDKFYTLAADSRNSCLVGAMVADIVNEVGQTLRLVSFTANMCGSVGNYVAHTSRGQASQTHMEIFQLERLGQILKHLALKESFSAIDIGILGMKTSTVVSENSMCPACSGTKVTQLDNLLKGDIGKVKLDVNFLSIA
jgi:hypothetical protein